MCRRYSSKIDKSTAIFSLIRIMINRQETALNVIKPRARTVAKHNETLSKVFQND